MTPSVVRSDEAVLSVSAERAIPHRASPFSEVCRTGGYGEIRASLARLPLWCLRRRRARHSPSDLLAKEISHAVVRLDASEGVLGLTRLAAQEAEHGRLLHILWHDT